MEKQVDIHVHVCDVVKLRISGIEITSKPDINFKCCIADRTKIW